MPSKTRKLHKVGKVKVFSKLHKKSVSKKGTHYSVEKIGVVSEYPKLKGDIVKKYEGGKLTDQKFISDKKMKDLFENHKKKINTAMKGGATKNPQVVYVQQPIQEQAPPTQNISYQNNTTGIAAAKQSFGSTLGAEAALGIGYGVFEAVFGNGN